MSTETVFFVFPLGDLELGRHERQGHKAQQQEVVSGLKSVVLTRRRFDLPSLCGPVSRYSHCHASSGMHILSTAAPREENDFITNASKFLYFGSALRET